MKYDFETRQRIKDALKDRQKRYGCDRFSARDVLDGEARSAGRLPIDWAAFDHDEAADA